MYVGLQYGCTQQNKFVSAAVFVLVGVFLFLTGPEVFAEDQATLLRFSYWHEADAPFVVQAQDEAASQGFIFDLGKLIAVPLRREPEFVRLPVARIEPWLQSGQVDIDCVTIPAWKQAPTEYHWSPVIFNSADNVLVRKGDGNRFRSLDDLQGQKVGVYQSYTYHPSFRERVGQGKIETVRMNDLSHGLQLLRLGRIDALVEFGVILQYQLGHGRQLNEFELAVLTIDEFKLQCAYSSKMAVDPAQVDKVIQDLVDRGEVERILTQYR